MSFAGDLCEVSILKQWPMLTLHIFLSSDELNFWGFHIMLMLIEMLRIKLYVLLLSEIISFHS
jgi:hypothetical protein